jgi:hypothetical protein
MLIPENLKFLHSTLVGCRHPASGVGALRVLLGRGAALPLVVPAGVSQNRYAQLQMVVTNLETTDCLTTAVALLMTNVVILC